MYPWAQKFERVNIFSKTGRVFSLNNVHFPRPCFRVIHFLCLTSHVCIVLFSFLLFLSLFSLLFNIAFLNFSISKAKKYLAITLPDWIREHKISYHVQNQKLWFTTRNVNKESLCWHESHREIWTIKKHWIQSDSKLYDLLFISLCVCYPFEHAMLSLFICPNVVPDEICSSWIPHLCICSSNPVLRICSWKTEQLTPVLPQPSLARGSSQMLFRGFAIRQRMDW